MTNISVQRTTNTKTVNQTGRKDAIYSTICYYIHFVFINIIIIGERRDMWSLWTTESLSAQGFPSLTSCLNDKQVCLNLSLIVETIDCRTHMSTDIQQKAPFTASASGHATNGPLNDSILVFLLCMIADDAFLQLLMWLPPSLWCLQKQTCIHTIGKRKISTCRETL